MYQQQLNDGIFIAFGNKPEEKWLGYSMSKADSKNSAWSKPWLMQGTGKPW
jgi:hypothetical protein